MTPKTKPKPEPKIDEHEMLRTHGFVQHHLPASAILRTAESDLNLHRRRLAGQAATKRYRAGDKSVPQSEMDVPSPRFAFVKAHVEMAKDARDLLDVAIKAGVGAAGTYSQRVIYGDHEGLRAAIALTEPQLAIA